MIEKTAPPKTHPRAKHDWEEFAATLKADPGQWYRMPCTNRSLSTQIAAGRYSAFRSDSGRFDTATRKVDGVVYLYAVYRTD
jgi:hypothetical protein